MSVIPSMLLEKYTSIMRECEFIAIALGAVPRESKKTKQKQYNQFYHMTLVYMVRYISLICNAVHIKHSIVGL